VIVSRDKVKSQAAVLVDAIPMSIKLPAGLCSTSGFPIRDTRLYFRYCWSLWANFCMAW